MTQRAEEHPEPKPPSEGQPAALRDLARRFAELYEELRRVAHFLVRNERPSATLSATALVHDAYVRMLGSVEGGSATPEQLVAFAACIMRRMLIDRARRPSHRHHASTPVDPDLPASDPRFATSEQWEAYQVAFAELAKKHPRAARAYEFCVGWEVPTTVAAEQFQIPLRTLQVDIALARAFLHQALGPAPVEGGGGARRDAR